MNILMLDKYLTVGGVATYLKTLSEAMMQKGHTLFLLTAADEDNQQIIEMFSSSGIHVITVPVRKNKILTAYQFIKRSYKFIKENSVDIIHSHHRIVNFAGIVISRISSVPHLITLHVIKNDYQLLHRLWKAQPITVPSETSKKHLVQYYNLNENSIHVIYNAISPDFTVDAKQKQHLKKEMFSDSEKFYVGYVGRISHEKGVDVLLRSIPLVKSRCPGIAFRIFGDGADFNKLKQRSREMGLNSGQLFQGTNYHVNELLTLMDLCVIPSRSESFCLFALECMRAQKPIIASAAGGLQEVIEDEKTGLLVETEDYILLADRIVALYKNKKLARQLAQNGRQQFEENFSLEVFCRKYESLYQRLINGINV